VTLRALQRSVRAGQGKAGNRMVELRISPGSRIVANLAGLRYSGFDVIRIGRALVVLHVAGHAGSIFQVVVPVDMALRARSGGVLAREREASGGVIEGGVGPRGRVVASCAGGGNAGLLVVRIVRPVVILHVAGSAILGGEVVISVGVALRALQSGMGSGQRESHQVVIKRCRLPGAGAVARLAGLGEIRSHVVWVGGFTEVRQMASHAIGRRALEFAADVTRVAVERGMHSGQREARIFQVVKLDAEPVVELVTLVAACREPSGHVGGASGSLIVLRVAGVALRR